MAVVPYLSYLPLFALLPPAPVTPISGPTHHLMLHYIERLRPDAQGLFVGAQRKELLRVPAQRLRLNIFEAFTADFNSVRDVGGGEALELVLLGACATPQGLECTRVQACRAPNAH